MYSLLVSVMTFGLFFSLMLEAIFHCFQYTSRLRIESNCIVQ